MSGFPKMSDLVFSFVSNVLLSYDELQTAEMNQQSALILQRKDNTEH